MKLPLVLATLGLGLSTLQASSPTPTLNTLARDLTRLESVREIKDLAATFAQFSQWGRYGDMAALFASDGTLSWSKSSPKGPAAIEAWLRSDAEDMNALKPGSLDTLVMANPLVNLAVDGKSAKARFNGWRFQGDGAGKTRIQGGIYENEYVVGADGIWRVSLMGYHPLYEGDYAKGWMNAGGGNLATVKFHYTPDEAGIPIPPPVGEAPATNLTLSELEERISVLNDEDDVRNLQHAYGYYVDRRMWTDVMDLFAPNSTVKVDNVGSWSGSSGVRQALEKWMGPEGLSQGVLNEHLLFETVVRILPAKTPRQPREALSRGVEIVLGGDANKTAGWWQFNTFSNRFTQEDGIWKLKDMSITPLTVANYSTGWAKGSTLPPPTSMPSFLSTSRTTSTTLKPTTPSPGTSNTTTALTELQRRLARSAAFDGAENVSNAYGFYIDFIDGAGCANMAAIHAPDSHKESPFTGWYQTRARVLAACTQYYGTSTTLTRSSISFHWRPQPVILVSADGRSASLRARLLQPGTEREKAGLLRGAIYHDQMILSPEGSAASPPIWRLWSVTIDEFYFTTSSWKDGWAGVKARAKDARNPADRSLNKEYPPDLLLTALGDPRETGFQGGTGRFVAWPEIQRMWFAYRNPVSGRVPDSYWPGCVPCKAKPAWSLLRNGFQEPPTGPTLVKAAAVPGENGTMTVEVYVTAGPDEGVTGVLRLEGDGVDDEQELLPEKTGRRIIFALPEGLKSGNRSLTVRYLGSDRLATGQTSLVVSMP